MDTGDYRILYMGKAFTMVEPEFFWQDLSGRGETATLYLSSFVDFDEEVEDEEPPLSEWIQDASIGEVWESHSERYTRIK